MAAGSATITEEIFDTVKFIKWTWTSGDGTTATMVAGTTTAFYSGRLLFFVTIPSASVAPTDNYDVTVLDKNDVDVLSHAGFDRDTASTETVVAASLGAVANSQLELNIAGAGSAHAGIVYLWIR